MALDGDTLYVADRKNHALRALNLKDQTVKPVAGTGEQDRTGRDGGGAALKTGLNSPWDLLYHKNKLFIAMAGHHQIWTFDLAKQTVDPYAGNGREDIGDGALARSLLRPAQRPGHRRQPSTSPTARSAPSAPCRWTARAT